MAHRRRPTPVPRGWLLVGLWVALTLLAVAAILANDLRRARDRLDEIANGLLQHVSDRALVSETAVEGFAAFVASRDEPDLARTRDYARTLLARYPYLYMFEIAQRVVHAERADFEAQQAVRHPGFRIKRFGYESDRSWHTMEQAELYYPLVFQEPQLDGPADLLGLDINSSGFLRQAMEASFARGEPVATHPFDLAEGWRGYVLHRSVEHLSGRPPHAFAAQEYALLALKSAQLFPALAATPHRLAVHLSHRDFALEDPRGAVYRRPGDEASARERLLLPRFERQQQLTLASQPLVLRVAWQLRWRDLSLAIMGLMLLASLLLLGGARVYAGNYLRERLQAMEREGELYRLANFDALTGLANRNHLLDYLEAALARARRSQQPLTVLFIDVDGFKRVNDSRGHAIGDAVLREVARRLQRHLREEDLLARYGGDEFVWVAGAAPGEQDLQALVRRLKQEFAAPIELDGAHFALGVSIGQAIYPRDGRSAEAVLHAADQDMYRDKGGCAGAR